MPSPVSTTKGLGSTPIVSTKDRFHKVRYMELKYSNEILNMNGVFIDKCIAIGNYFMDDPSGYL